MHALMLGWTFWYRIHSYVLMQNFVAYGFGGVHVNKFITPPKSRISSKVNKKSECNFSGTHLSSI